MKREFKVGDKVLTNMPTEDPCKIVGYWHKTEYLVNLVDHTDKNLDYDSFVNDSATTGLIPFEGCAVILTEKEISPAYKDIHNTKIARKMHPDAEDIGNGKLRIHL